MNGEYLGGYIADGYRGSYHPGMQISRRHTVTSVQGEGHPHVPEDDGNGQQHHPDLTVSPAMPENLSYYN